MTGTGDGGKRLSASALERRVKRWLLQAPFESFVQCAPGLEGTLSREVEGLGLVMPGAQATAQRGGVALPLDLDGLMRANLELRTAGRVLLRLAQFPAASHEMLFDRTRKLPWEVHIGFHETYSLKMSARGSKLQAGDYLAKTLSAAIARRMGEVGLAPHLSEESPLNFQVRLHGDRCTVSLDTSGEHLHRRGLRTHVHTAPLRETLAAATVLEGLSGMTGRPDMVVDPFCGSGTLLLEAVDVLLGLPPGRKRRFAFEEAAWHRPGRWREVRRRAGLAGGERDAGPVDHSGVEAGSRDAGPVDQGAVAAPADSGADRDRRNPGGPPRFLGIDIDLDALRAARENLSHHEYGAVDLEHADSLDFDFDALGARRGLLIANLPYGVRLGQRKEAVETVQRFLDRLAAGKTRWRVAVLSSDEQLVARVLDGAKSLATSNGGLRVWLTTGAIGGQ